MRLLFKILSNAVVLVVLVFCSHILGIDIINEMMEQMEKNCPGEYVAPKSYGVPEISLREYILYKKDQSETIEELEKELTNDLMELQLEQAISTDLPIQNLKQRIRRGAPRGTEAFEKQHQRISKS
jgi:hypothetical protein